MSKDKSARGGFKRSVEAQRIAAKLPELCLEARKLASQIQGMRKRSKAGSGTEFHSFRLYDAGADDPRKIDFKASARTPNREGGDTLLIREREMEVKKTYYLWCDLSGSMDYKSDKALYTKKEVAETLLMASAYLAIEAGEQFTLLGSGMKLRNDRKAIDALTNEISLHHDSGEDLPKVPAHRGKRLEKNSHIFIFTDALSPPEELLQSIKTLFHAGTKGHIIQILDRQELELDFSGRIKFTDMENEGAFVEKGKVESIRDDYKKEFEAHQNSIKNMIKNIPGWDFATFVTDQPLHHALMPLYGIKPQKLPTPTLFKK